MNSEELAQLTNEELLAEAKKMKSFSISNALADLKHVWAEY